MCPCLSRGLLPSVVGGRLGAAAGVVPSLFCCFFCFFICGGGSCECFFPLFLAGTRRRLPGAGALCLWLSVLSCCGPPSAVVGGLVAYCGRGSLGRRPPPRFLFCAPLWFPASRPCCVRGPAVGGTPLPWRESVSASPGWSFLCPIRGPVAVVVRLLWLRPVAGLGRVVSRCPSSGSRGCRAWSRLAGGLPVLVEWLRGVGVLWLSLLPPSAPPG